VDINIWTVSGAAAGAGVLTQFAKALFPALNAVKLRAVALISGAVIFLSSVLLTAQDISPLFIVGALITAAQAGLSAIAGFDTADKGIDYRVSKAPE
jgi:hypothetical protein